MSAPGDSAAAAATFRDLFQPELWARLTDGAERVHLPAGTVLMRMGEEAPPLFVVDDGSVDVVDTRGSPETVLDMLGPGRVVGDMSYLDGAPAAAEVRARVHADCFRWERESLSALLDADLPLALVFYKAMAQTAVQQTRTVMSAAAVGGFGAGGPTRERASAVEADRVAYTLAMDLLDALAGGHSEADPRRDGDVSRALTAIGRWFAVVGDPERADEVGSRLRELLAEVLGSSKIAAHMLERVDGAPAGPHLFRHVLSGEPDGEDAAGILLDRALQKLPTVRGWRWRDQSMAKSLDVILPMNGARVLSVSLTGAPTSRAQHAVLQSRAGHVTSVNLAPRPPLSETPAGITRVTVVADLPSLLRGTAPRVGARHHAVLVDRVSDVVPDEVLRSLLAWARRQLEPGGALVIGHALPADDTAMLDHLLRWPSIPRRNAAVIALLPRGGHHDALAPQDDEAAGVVTWRSAR